MTTVQFIKYWEVMSYVFGGRAIITIVSNKTQTHFTYKFVASKNGKNSAGNDVGNFVVYTLVGKKYLPFGKVVWYGKKFIYIPGYVPKSWVRYKAFMWVWRHIINKVFPKGVYIWREDKCCVCGKRLTHPESIVKGIGPECIKTYSGIMPNGGK